MTAAVAAAAARRALLLLPLLVAPRADAATEVSYADWLLTRDPDPPTAKAAKANPNKAGKNKAGKAGARRTKGTKGSKACNPFGEDGDGDRLVGVLRRVSGSSFEPSGTVTATFNPDHSFLLSLDAAGLDPSCVDDPECRVVITQADACDDPLSADPLYAGDEDPWDAVTFDAPRDGMSNSAWRVYNGYTRHGNRGRAAVVYRGGEWIGCGILEAAPEALDRSAYLRAEIGTYPGYEGDVKARGSVEVTYRVDGTFKFGYDLTGLEADCVDCGAHIHAGTSCASPELVLGHGWNTDAVQDLWTTAGGATYRSDGEGDARGHFHLYNGYSYGKSLGHAVVIHGQDGTRVGCGVLERVVA